MERLRSLVLGARLRPRRVVGALVALLLVGLVPSAMARPPGAGDDGYGDHGFEEHDSHVGQDWADAMYAMADGRTVVVSTARRENPDWYRDQRSFVTRLLPNGQPDPTFGTGGTVAVGATVTGLNEPSVVASADGSVTLFAPAGRYKDLVSFEYVVDLIVYRWTSTGQPDTAWSGNGTGSRTVTAVDGEGLATMTAALDAGGQPIGQVTYYRSYPPEARIVQYRVLPGLAPDPAFGGGDGEITDGPFALDRIQDPQGRWVSVGQDHSYDPVIEDYRDRLVVSRRLADGSVDLTFGTGGSVTFDNTPGRISWGPFFALGLVGTDVIAGSDRGIVRVDDHGVPRPGWGTGGILDLYSGDDAEVLDVGGQLVLAGKEWRNPCVTTHRVDGAGQPVAGWGDGGELELCPRRGVNALVDASDRGTGFRLLTTSTGITSRDDTATVTRYDDAGHVVGSYGTGGSALIRFGNEGPDRAAAIALLPGGRARVAVTTPDGPGILQVDAHGDADPVFGGDGLVTSTAGLDEATSLVVLADGRTILGGTGGLLAFRPDGSLDPGFGDGGFVEGGWVNEVIQLSSGRIVVAEQLRIVAYRLDGSLDTAFGVNGQIVGRETYASVVNRGTGFVVASNDIYDGAIAAFTALGQPDPSFAGGQWQEAPVSYNPPWGPTLMAVGADGRVYVATGRDLVAFRANGSSVTLAEIDIPSPWDGTHGLVIDSAGRVIVGRTVDDGNLRLERLLPSGERDTTFGDDGALRIGPGPSGYAGLSDLAIDAQDRLFMATSESIFADDADVSVARYDTRIPAELPVVTIGDAVQVEGDDDPNVEGPDGQAIRIPIFLDRPSQVFTWVEVEAHDGTAVEDRDFDVGPPQAYISPGDTEGFLWISTIGDDRLEGDETFTVDLVEGDQLLLGDRTHATVTIEDDDIPDLTRRTTQVIAGPDRIATAIAISQDRYGGGMPLVDTETRDPAGSVVLARADQHSDALAGTPFAATLHAPILLTGRDHLDPRVLEEIRRILGQGNLNQKVHLLGGTASLGPAIEQELSRAGYSVVRHAGPDRFSTAAAIAEEMEASEVLLVTGRDFADGLAAGAAAARRSGVVLLTDGATMPPATAAYLAAHPELPVTAIGGPAGRAAPGARLIAGADRYATAVAVATQLFPESVPVAGLASGETFPDALAGGAHVAGRGGPLLLTRRSSVPQGVATYVHAHVTNRLVVYGGASAVDPASLSAVED